MAPKLTLLGDPFRKAITVTNVIIDAALPVCYVHVCQTKVTYRLLLGCRLALQTCLIRMSPVELPLAANYGLTAFRLQLVIHSVLASRILFHLRSSDGRAHDTDMPLLVSAARFGGPSQMQTNEIQSGTNEV